MNHTDAPTPSGTVLTAEELAPDAFAQTANTGVLADPRVPGAVALWVALVALLTAAGAVALAFAVAS